MNKFLYHACYLWLSISLTAIAQQASISPPTPPLVHESPAGTTWTIDISQSNATAGRTPEQSPKRLAPVRIEARIGMNNVEEGTIAYSDGHKERFLIAEGQVLKKSDNSNRISSWSTTAPAGNLADLRVSGFPCVSWLSQNYYIGIETIKNEKCWKFVMPANESFPIGSTAWISTSTSHPVRVLMEDNIYDFSPVKSFSGSVIPPPEFQAILDANHQQNRVLQMMMEQAKSNSR